MMRAQAVSRALDILRNITFPQNPGMYERQLGYLITLANEKSLSRAASICNVSSLSISSAIKSLENKLELNILKAGSGFQGFTPEGEHILAWARQALSAQEPQKQEGPIAAPTANGNAQLRLGAVPTAMPIVPLLTRGLQSMHYKARPRVMAKSAEEIVQQLKNAELEIGVSYLDELNLEGLHVQPIYTERLILVGRDLSSIKQRKEITWRDAARLPLCLLVPEMMNRQIVDKAFRDAGAQPNIVVETDTIFALYSQLRSGEIFSIVPHSFFYLSEWRDEFLAIPIAPQITHTIGLISLNQEPCTPIVSAMRAVINQLDFQNRLDEFLTASNQVVATDSR